MWKEKIAAPIVEPAAEIHHPDTDWIKKNLQTLRRLEWMRERKRKRGKKKKKQKQREEEKVSCTEADLLSSYIKRKRMDEGCGGHRLSA